VTNTEKASKLAYSHCTNCKRTRQPHTDHELTCKSMVMDCVGGGFEAQTFLKGSDQWKWSSDGVVCLFQHAVQNISWVLS